MLNLSLEVASVFGLPIVIGRSSDQISKVSKVTSIIADNHNKELAIDLLTQSPRDYLVNQRETSIGVKYSFVLSTLITFAYFSYSPCLPFLGFSD